MKCKSCKRKVMEGMESCPFCGAVLLEMQTIQNVKTINNPITTTLPPLKPLGEQTVSGEIQEAKTEETLVKHPVETIEAPREEAKQIEKPEAVVEEKAPLETQEESHYYSPTAPEVEDSWPASPVAMILKVTAAVMCTASVALYMVYIL